SGTMTSASANARRNGAPIEVIIWEAPASYQEGTDAASSGSSGGDRGGTPRRQEFQPAFEADERPEPLARIRPSVQVIVQQQPHTILFDIGPQPRRRRQQRIVDKIVQVGSEPGVERHAKTALRP